MDFLREEIPKAFERTFDGVERVTTIVKAMKEFAHPDATNRARADLNHAIGTTLLVASNEYKYLAKVRTEFGELPQVVCNIGELNQVFLNLIGQCRPRDSRRREGRERRGNQDQHDALRRDGGHSRERTQRLRRSRREPLQALRSVFYDEGSWARHGTGLAITHSIVVDKHGGEDKRRERSGDRDGVHAADSRRWTRCAGESVKNIVFVDDERELLESLRARLYKHRHEWNMKFLLSGAEAIEAFESQPVDLIVSDVRMPGWTAASC